MKRRRWNTTATCVAFFSPLPSEIGIQTSPATAPARRPKMRITFLNQKGGVGKSTVCIAVGASLARAGFSVGFDDRDPQGSVEFWARHVGMFPLVGGIDSPQVVLCDTPGRLDLNDPSAVSLLTELIRTSDRLVLVSEKSLFSVHATAPMVRIIHAHKNPEAKVFLLLNKVRSGSTLSAAAEKELAHQLGVPLAGCSLPLSIAFEHLQTKGLAALRRRQLELVLQLALELVS